MNEQQVDVVGLHFAQALVDATCGFFLAGVSNPHLGGEEQLVACNAALLDGFAHAFLVIISLSRIDQPVTDAQCIGHAALAFLRAHQENTVTQQRHFHSIG